MRRLITFPARNLLYVIPAMITAGLLTGYFFDTSPLKTLILPVSVLMVYPAMIGIRFEELARFTEYRLMALNLGINFLALPFIAFLVGRLLLASSPELFTGLVIVSVIPGGNMVVALTMMFQGNVRASLKLTAVNLLLGSLLAPFYLYLLAGRLVEVDLWQVGRTITLVVFIPLVMGMYTYRLLLRRYPPQTFKKEIKPLLPGFSSWGLMYILFTSMSLKSKMIFSHPGLLFQALASLFFFYFLVSAMLILLARNFFDQADGMTLFLNGLLRNLAIAISLAVTAFDTQVAMEVALAFLFQQQIAIWFWKLDSRFALLRRPG